MTKGLLANGFMSRLCSCWLKKRRWSVAAKVLLWRCWCGGAEGRLGTKQQGLRRVQSEMRGAAAGLCRVEKIKGRGGWWLLFGLEKKPKIQNPLSARGFSGFGPKS